MIVLTVNELCIVVIRQSCNRSLLVRPSVCRLSSFCLSVTFVHPTQAIEIFGNVSTPFGTLAIW